jgi:putative endonuclease
VNSRALGAAAEQFAARYLRSRGYRVCEMNYTCATGEADIVAEEGGALVFVEVKARRSADFGAPRQQVGPRKRRALSRVAECYCEQHRLSDRSIRFDIAEVALDERGEPQAVEIVEAAFGDERGPVARRSRSTRR